MLTPTQRRKKEIPSSMSINALASRSASELSALSTVLKLGLDFRADGLVETVSDSSSESTTLRLLLDAFSTFAITGFAGAVSFGSSPTDDLRFTPLC